MESVNAPAITYVHVMYKGKRYSMHVNSPLTGKALFESIWKQIQIPVSRQLVFLGEQKILESTDLSTLDLQGTFQVLLCSYVFVYCCGVVISSVFPLSYKSSVFVQYHVPLFREKGIQVDPSFVDCFYHSYKMQPDRSLQSYGIQESDMIVFHDRRFSEGSWMQVVEGLRERIAELEKKVEEDEETIALLSSQLQ
ncbi:hypothetical protein WA556_001363, partial [Blastocystis sp. ATCC 50177/Nand II]